MVKLWSYNARSRSMAGRPEFSRRWVGWSSKKGRKTAEAWGWLWLESERLVAALKGCREGLSRAAPGR